MVKQVIQHKEGQTNLPTQSDDTSSGSGGRSGWSGLLIGGLVGAAASFILTPVYYGSTKSHFFEDGQWGLIYFLSVQSGALLGALLGCAIESSRSEPNSQ